MSSFLRMFFAILLGLFLVFGTVNILLANEPAMSKEEISARIRIAHRHMDRLEIDAAYTQLEKVRGEYNLRYLGLAYCTAWQRWSATWKAVLCVVKKGK